MCKCFCCYSAGQKLSVSITIWSVFSSALDSGEIDWICSDIKSAKVLFLRMFGFLLELPRLLKTFACKNTEICEKRNMEIRGTCQLRAKI